MPLMRKSEFSGQKPKCRALSAGRAFRQARLAALALFLASPAVAAPGGTIDTLRQGSYICELPGDAAGLAGVHIPAEDFTVVTASSYRAAGGMGSYLLIGDQLTMTGGPHVGKQY